MPRYIDQSLCFKTALTFRQLYHLTIDLRLSDKEYLLCLTVFYFSYSLFEVRLPSRASSSHFEHVFIGPEQYTPQETPSQHLAVNAYAVVGCYYGEYSCSSLVLPIVDIFSDFPGSCEKLRTAPR